MKQTLHHKRKRHTYVWLVALAVALAIIVAAGTILLVLIRRSNGGSSTSGDSSGSYGGNSSPGAPGTAVTVTQKTLPLSFIDRNTASPYIVLGNVTTGATLYSKNATEKCFPASLTKLMTALVALDYTTAETEITVGNEIYMIDPGSSRAYLTQGTRLTMEQLLQALLLPSGNDAAYTVAVQVGRIIAGDATLSNQAALDLFCQKMNDKAKTLGCTGTQFANPDGIHREDHYTTAADMLKIGTAVLNNPVVARIVATPMVEDMRLLSGQVVTWKNSNRLVQENNAYSYAGATGMKTGTTDEAGYCLIASAVRKGQTSIAVVMGAEAEHNRWEDASGLLDISFQ